MSDMTKDQFDRKMEMLVKKRDHCADVLGKVLLAMTYQQDINKLVDEYPDFADQFANNQ